MSNEPASCARPQSVLKNLSDVIAGVSVYTTVRSVVLSAFQKLCRFPANKHGQKVNQITYGLPDISHGNKSDTSGLCHVHNKMSALTPKLPQVSAATA